MRVRCRVSLPSLMRTVCGLLAVGLLAVPAAAVEIIGHRGASYDAPENTLASVRRAWEQNTDAVEIDIYLTADGHIVAMHDKTTKRTGGKDAPVASQTLDELRRLDVGRWKSPKFAGERIPTLDEILKTIPAGKRLFIEIKAGSEILPELRRVLTTADRPAAETVLIGFSYETMQAAKMLLPRLKAYWIVSLKPDKKTGRPNHTAAELIGKAKAAHLDGLDLGDAPFLNADFIREVKEAGLGAYVWTVNDAAKARAYRAAGIDGITTDRPGWLREQLKDTKSQ